MLLAPRDFKSSTGPVMWKTKQGPAFCYPECSVFYCVRALGTLHNGRNLPILCLEQVCCEKRQKIVPDQLLVSEVGYLWRILTRLTWLIHTSVLPSSWNPGKIFAPTDQLVQVDMVKKIFPIFLHAGSWSFLLMNLRFSSKLVSKMN